jgi:hypothetical protein
MIGHDPNADPFAQCVIVVAGHMSQHSLTIGQTQGV